MGINWRWSMWKCWQVKTFKTLKGDDIQERLIDFVVAMIKLCASLPKTQAGKEETIVNCQLIEK